MDININQGIPTQDHSLVRASLGSHSHEKPHQPLWERLPVEIMEVIFLLCRPLQKYRPPCKTHAPYLLTYVCRSWYKITVELAEMWSTVVLSPTSDFDSIPPSRLEAGTHHLAMCITRCKPAPRILCIRAEFLAYPASFEHVQRVEWRHLLLVFPEIGSSNTGGILPSFFPLSLRMMMPRLVALEIHGWFTTISNSDQGVLSGIIDSAQALKRYTSPKNGATRIPAQLSLPNMSKLEVLALQQTIPTLACPFILQSAPSLRRLSLAVGRNEDDELGHGSIDSLHTSTRPLIHPHLEYLALVHSKCDLSALFECLTLPLLQFLVLDFRARGAQAYWSHNNFVAFLKRSNCKLKSFHVLDQPISPLCLLELLHLPHLADSLEYLGIQNYVEGELVINNSVLDKLTLPSVTSQEEDIPSIPALDPAPVSARSFPILCPNIERLILFVPLEGFTLRKLIAMFNSRLPSNINSTFSHKALRQVEMDLYEDMHRCEEMKTEFESLRKNGLVLTLFEPASSDATPPDAEQQKLWRRHLSEGFDDEVYDHVTGAWRPSDITLAMP